MTSGLKRSNPRGALRKQISVAVFARETQLLQRTDEGGAMEHVNAETLSGEVRGIVNNGISVFKGMPYGDGADGDARSSPPSKPESWAGVRDAFEFGPRAIQNDNAFAMPPELLKLFGAEPLLTNENCLVLNVWTPAVGDGRNRPVMFWCHGGEFISGSGSSPWYDDTQLARKGDVVAVTINHRLNVFGFLHLDELGGGDAFASSGSAGMLDIVAALKWVRDNIAAFGGNPDKGASPRYSPGLRRGWQDGSDRGPFRRAPPTPVRDRRPARRTRGLAGARLPHQNDS
jgi:Carboxylesterase family